MSKVSKFYEGLLEQSNGRELSDEELKSFLDSYELSDEELEVVAGGTSILEQGTSSTMDEFSKEEFLNKIKQVVENKIKKIKLNEPFDAAQR
ncbi:MAG: hypothetical protein LBK04_03055 [Clostridiales Family XIII bacterium]|nr:hypothetical protein [Clostridiales Family XIII bacterium]